MTANSLIDITLEEIATEYQTGTLAWMKRNRPGEWRTMLSLEEETNQKTLKGDMEGLKEVLKQYKRLIHRMVRAFKTPIGEAGDLFNYL